MQREKEREENWWVVGTTWNVIRDYFQLLGLPPDMALVCRIIRFSINALPVPDRFLVEGLMLTECGY